MKKILVLICSISIILGLLPTTFVDAATVVNPNTLLERKYLGACNSQ